MPRSDPQDQRVRSAYDALAPSYDRTFGDAASRAEDAKAERLLHNALLPLAVQAGRDLDVLDVGSGTGWFLDQPRLRDLTANYVGFDLSDGMTARLWEKHGAWLEGEVGDYGSRGLAISPFSMRGTWPTGYQEFDAVVSTFASPSYDDAGHFAREAHRCLRPGGRVFLMPWGCGLMSRPHLMAEEGTYAGATAWTEGIARRAFAGWEDVRVRGMRRPRPLPARTPQTLSALDLALDRWRNPSHLSFLIVEATRP